MVERIKALFEQKAYGVCEWLGEKLGIESAKIRLFFIYTSFLTIGSPIIIYMILAFWIELKNLVNGRRNRVWDL
jgi:phage shock protein PspC (stress-responsive transcriptional regulator)